MLGTLLMATMLGTLLVAAMFIISCSGYSTDTGHQVVGFGWDQGWNDGCKTQTHMPSTSTWAWA